MVNKIPVFVVDETGNRINAYMRNLNSDNRGGMPHHNPIPQSVLADPAHITTHEQANEIITVLDHEIANIEAALECARVEAATSPLPEHRMDWVRRAAYAAAMKRNARHRIIQRDKELRGTKGPAITQPRKDPGEGVAKQARLQAEAEERKAAKVAEAERNKVRLAEIEALRSWRKQFVELARDAIPADQFDHLMAEAKRRSGNNRMPD